MKNILGSGFGLRSVFRITILFLLLWIVSCASLPKLEAPTRSRSDLINQTSAIPKFSILDSKTTRAKLSKIKRALAKGKLTASGLKLHDELLETYIRLKALASTKIEVPAHSRLTISLETYCLDSGKASPVADEYFYWQKSKDPGIKYYQKILNFRRQQKISRKETQTLLWNLANKTNWENYPDRLKTILKSIDLQAAVKLPSELRSQVIDAVADQVLQVPGVSEVRDTARLIEGKFYEFDDIRRRVESLTSTDTLKLTALVPQLPKSEIFAESKSEGFEGQEVTFYNPTDKLREIDLTQYYLAPARSDVQRIGINPLIADDASLLSDLEKVLFDDMARIGIGFTPGLNDLADVFELLTGLDFVSGRGLSSFDRMLSGIGVVAGSGQAYRYVKRAVHSPVKHIDQFSGGLSKAVGKPVQLTLDNLEVGKSRAFGAKQVFQNAKMASPVDIHHGSGRAVQEFTAEALRVRAHVDDGGLLYRVGTSGRSQTGRNAQYWSPENPTRPGYSEKFGIPEENLKGANFVETGRIRSGTNYVTRKAPGVGSNSGGAIEVVVPKGGVQIQSHNSL